MSPDLIYAVLTGTISGGITAGAIIATLRNDIRWLKATIEELRAAVTRAHTRIDAIHDVPRDR